MVLRRVLHNYYILESNTVRAKFAGLTLGVTVLVPHTNDNNNWTESETNMWQYLPLSCPNWMTIVTTVSLAACAPCCPCSGNQRLSRWLSCTWPAASVSLTSRSGPPSSRHAAGGSSLSRTFQLSCSKVLLMKPELFLLFHQYFISFQQKLCLCFIDICHQILDLYSQGNKPIPQQIQEKERSSNPPLPAPPVPLGQPPASNPPPPPPKKTSPQGGSPARQLKRSHVSICLCFWPLLWRHWWDRL